MEGVKSIPNPREIEGAKSSQKPVSYDYQRPAFLGLSQSDLDEAKDHGIRKILQPSDVASVTWNAGYAEVINSGKTMFKNEDQASFYVESIDVIDSDTKHVKLPYAYFGIFDGHAGADAALWAANTLHKHVEAKLDGIKQYLIQNKTEVVTEDDPSLGYITEPIPKDELIIGALEKAFVEMDEQIRTESQMYKIDGGCTVLVVLFLQNKLYVANAGDCRAFLLLNDFSDIIPMSMDFTPETDRIRLQTLAFLQPQLLGDYFGRLEFQRRLRKKDKDSKVFCRDRHTNGWIYHTVTEHDVTHVPMISGHGKRARLLATIGTSRGFGDHFLEAPGNIFVKPFLTPLPEVRVYDLDTYQFKETDVLIMASDGLWECLSNKDASQILQETYEKMGKFNETFYHTAAYDLIAAARGIYGPKGWRIRNHQIASGDDITCFIIPLCKYKEIPSTKSDHDPVLFGAPSINSTDSTTSS